MNTMTKQQINNKIDELNELIEDNKLEMETKHAEIGALSYEIDEIYKNNEELQKEAINLLMQREKVDIQLS